MGKLLHDPSDITISILKSTPPAPQHTHTLLSDYIEDKGEAYINECISNWSQLSSAASTPGRGGVWFTTCKSDASSSENGRSLTRLNIASISTRVSLNKASDWIRMSCSDGNCANHGLHQASSDIIGARCSSRASQIVPVGGMRASVNAAAGYGYGYWWR
jgi:hypothetical protein